MKRENRVNKKPLIWAKREGKVQLLVRYRFWTHPHKTPEPMHLHFVIQHRNGERMGMGG